MAHVAWLTMLLMMAGELSETVIATNGARFGLQLLPALRGVRLLPHDTDTGDALLGVLIENEIYALPFHQCAAHDLEVTEQVEFPSGVLFRARVPGRETEVQIRLRSPLTPGHQPLGEAPMLLIDIAVARAPRATRAIVALPMRTVDTQISTSSEPPGTIVAIGGSAPHELGLFGGAPFDHQGARGWLAREAAPGTTFLVVDHVKCPVPTPLGSLALAYTAAFANARAIGAAAFAHVQEINAQIDVVDDVVLGADVPVALKQIVASGVQTFLASTTCVRVDQTASRCLVSESADTAMRDQVPYYLAFAPARLAAWIAERSTAMNEDTPVAQCAELVTIAATYLSAMGDDTILQTQGPAWRRLWPRLSDSELPQAAVALLAGARIESVLGGSEQAARMDRHAREALQKADPKRVIDHLPLLLRAGIDPGVPTAPLLDLCQSTSEEANLWRDVVACYLGSDPTRRWPAAREALASHFEVRGPNAVAALAFLEGLAGLVVDRSTKRVTLRPVRAPLRVPLLGFASLESGVVPWFEVVAGPEGPTWSITHRERLIGMHVAVDMSVVGG